MAEGITITSEPQREVTAGLLGARITTAQADHRAITDARLVEIERRILAIEAALKGD